MQLYYEDVSDIKKLNSTKILIYQISIIMFTIFIFIVAFIIMGYKGIIGLIIGILYFYPHPYIPDKFEITDMSIICNEKKQYSFKKLNLRRYKIGINNKEKYVSIDHRVRGPHLRLYTNEPQKVFDILQQLMLPLSISKVT